jgi:hypothetical protein
MAGTTVFDCFDVKVTCLTRDRLDGLHGLDAGVA